LIGTVGQIRCSFRVSKGENLVGVSDFEYGFQGGQAEIAVVPDQASGAPGAPLHVQPENR
jgi:hypothetical protein